MAVSNNKNSKIIFNFVVFEILLRVSEGKSFKEAFEMILPKRINMQPTSNDDSTEDGDTEKDDKSEKNT